MGSNVLSHERITGDGQPARWLYILHGIYGAGRNWATIARRVARARPEWGVVLVDLREHGGSQGFAPPHTIAAAARDVAQLAAANGLPVAALLGHSFGGKVALAFAQQGHDALRQLWVVDSTPEPRPPGGSAWRMLEIVRALPGRFGTRDDLITALERDGVERATAQWMATNLRSVNGHYAWRFDLEAIDALLRDFFRTDLLPVIESPPAGVDVRIVRATRSSVLSGEALRRVEAAAAAGRVHLDAIEGGHWLNADNPDAVTALLVDALP